MISLKAHNVLDYVMGLGWVGFSLLTNYSYSIARPISVQVHFALDVLIGIFLAFAPTMLGYQSAISGGQYGIHLIVGIAAIVLVLVTNRKQVLSEEEKFREAA